MRLPASELDRYSRSKRVAYQQHLLRCDLFLLYEPHVCRVGRTITPLFADRSAAAAITGIIEKQDREAGFLVPLLHRCRRPADAEVRVLAMAEKCGTFAFCTWKPANVNRDAVHSDVGVLKTTIRW